MGIPQLSMPMAERNAKTDFGLKMLGKSMETNEAAAASLVKMMDRTMELSVNPGVGSQLDLSV
ncbi:MAG: YjfB family protein [Lachnospiraceae bacterium]|nr:YjfB family protein [Lachnospiraceae bacterium]